MTYTLGSSAPSYIIHNQHKLLNNLYAVHQGTVRLKSNVSRQDNAPHQSKSMHIYEGQCFAYIGYLYWHHKQHVFVFAYCIYPTRASSTTYYTLYCAHYFSLHYPSLISTGSAQEDPSLFTERLLVGRKESNQTNKTFPYEKSRSNTWPVKATQVWQLTLSYRCHKM